MLAQAPTPPLLELGPVLSELLGQAGTMQAEAVDLTLKAMRKLTTSGVPVRPRCRRVCVSVASHRHVLLPCLLLRCAVIVPWHPVPVLWSVVVGVSSYHRLR